MRATFLAVLFLAAISRVALSAAQPADVTSPPMESKAAAASGSDGVSSLPGLERVIEIEKTYAPGRVQMLPGEPRVAVLKSIRAINIWELLVRFWPEVAGGVLILLSLIWLARLWRVRKLSPGHSYCRRCHYCLTGLRGETCTECGLLLTRRKRVSGRSVRIQIILAVLLVLITVADYFYHRDELPRSGTASEWQHWWSASLADFAEEHEIDWLRWRVRGCDRIAIIDLRTGEEIEILLTRPSLTSLQVHRRNQRLLVIDEDSGDDERYAVIEIDVLRGSKQVTAIAAGVEARLGPADESTGTIYLLLKETWDEPAHWYAALPNQRLQRIDAIQPELWSAYSFVPEWEWITPVQADPYDLLVAESVNEPAASISVGEDAPVERSNLVLIDVESNERRVVAESLPVLDLVVTRDGRSVYAAVWDEGILKWDLARPGHAASPVMTDDFSRSTSMLKIAPDGNQMVALSRPAHGSRIMRLLDLDAKRWAGSSTVVEDVWDVLISDDGRYAALVCSPNKLLVYALADAD